MNSALESSGLKQRSELIAAFDDPLMRFSIPDAVRKLSTEIDETAQSISARIRTISVSYQE